MEIAIVTGANGVLGREIVRNFVRSGIKVMALDLKFDQEDSEIFQSDLYKEYTIDITLDKELDMFIDKIGGQEITILVNNAAIPSGKRLHEIDTDEWEHVLDINLNAIFKLTRRVINKMITQEYGSIINVSSIDGIGKSNNIAYATSKAGLIRFTEVIAKSYGKYNIRANCIAPGFFKSSMVDDFYTNEAVEYLKKQIPLRRMADPVEIANVITFLASKSSSYITGSTLRVDGGYLI